MTEIVKPDVSIIIAAYNATETIRRAIDSAVAQQGVTTEIIVVDDCSTDETRSLVSAIGDPAVRLIALDDNRGPGGARNAGFAAAQGRWIAVLDSDDTMQPDRLARMVAASERVDADVAVDNLDVLHLDGRTERMFPDALLAGMPVLTLAAFIDSNRIFSATHNFGYMKPMFRRAFLEDNHLSFDEQLRIGEDYLLLASTLAAGGKCAVIPEAGYTYHIRESSISRVLALHHVDAMIEGDRRFLARFPLEGAAAAAQQRRTRNLAETRSFLAFIQHLKNRSLGPALKVALSDPVALRHLRMPIAARWRRLVSRPAHRKTAAPGAALPPSTAQDLPLRQKG